MASKCIDCQGEKVHSNQANDPDAWCQEIGNDYDANMPRALKPMTLRHNVKSQSRGPDAGADTFKIKAFHKISISICLQKVEILKRINQKGEKGQLLDNLQKGRCISGQKMSIDCKLQWFWFCNFRYKFVPVLVSFENPVWLEGARSPAVSGEHFFLWLWKKTFSLPDSPQSHWWGS